MRKCLNDLKLYGNNYLLVSTIWIFDHGKCRGALLSEKEWCVCLTTVIWGLELKCFLSHLLSCKTQSLGWINNWLHRYHFVFFSSCACTKCALMSPTEKSKTATSFDPTPPLGHLPASFCHYKIIKLGGNMAVSICSPVILSSVVLQSRCCLPLSFMLPNPSGMSIYWNYLSAFNILLISQNSLILASDALTSQFSVCWTGRSRPAIFSFFQKIFTSK